MFEYKDFGEDIYEIYHTLLAIYEKEKNKIIRIKAPEDYCECKPFLASNDIIIIEAVDYSQPK